MKVIDNDNDKSRDLKRNRVLVMSYFALAGYLITAVGVAVARYLHIVAISYSLIALLIIIASALTIGFILYIRGKDGLSGKEERVIFAGEYTLYISLSAIGFYYLGPTRYIGLIFSLVAVIVELPYTTFKESLLLAASSLAVVLFVGVYSVIILGNPGSIMQDIYYVAAFVPAFFLLSLVARQIAHQKLRINQDRSELEKINIRLRESNKRLRRTQEMTLSELDLACAVQSAFLPETPGQIDGWEIALAFKPCFCVSGDFYDFYFKDGMLKGLTIYDVSGHGVSSALLTMIAKPTMFDSFSQMETEPLDKVITEINRRLVSSFKNIDHFLTSILLRFDGNIVEYTNAGHPDLILRDGVSGETVMVAKNNPRFKGEPLGIDAREKPYYTECFTMKPGDMILLYTDCLIEAQNEQEEHFGEERLLHAFSSAENGSAQATLDSLLAALGSFANIDDILDDLTVIVLKKK